MAVMVFCKSCGKMNNRENELCSACGKPLKRSTTVRKTAEMNLPPPKGLERRESVSGQKATVSRVSTISCPQCGRANPGGGRFCNGCGFKLEEVEAETELAPTVAIEQEETSIVATGEIRPGEPGHPHEAPEGKPHRQGAVICSDCGVVNVGFEHCLECGARVEAPKVP